VSVPCGTHWKTEDLLGLVSRKTGSFPCGTLWEAGDFLGLVSAAALPARACLSSARPLQRQARSTSELDFLLVTMPSTDNDSITTAMGAGDSFLSAPASAVSQQSCHENLKS
jgi:hypothetical protein